MLNTITVGFSRSKKRFPIGSWIIRLYDRTSYSHVYLKFHSESLNRVLIYEAVGSGLRFIGSKAWESHAVEVASFDVEVIKGNYLHLLQYCVDNAGTEYGFMQNIGIPLSRLLGLKSNPFQSGKNCSEVVGEILKHEGYKLPHNDNLVTPKDIYEVLAKGK